MSTATKNEIFASNLSASGYSDYNEILTILNKLTPEEIEKLEYACYRTAEKIGEDAFDCSGYIAH